MEHIFVLKEGLLFTRKTKWLEVTIFKYDLLLFRAIGCSFPLLSQV